MAEEQVQYGGSLYKVWVGPKGGRYIKVKGRKIYLDKKNF